MVEMQDFLLARFPICILLMQDVLVEAEGRKHRIATLAPTKANPDDGIIPGDPQLARVAPLASSGRSSRGVRGLVNREACMSSQ